MACSDRYPRQNENPALAMTKAKIAIPSTGSPLQENQDADCQQEQQARDAQIDWPISPMGTLFPVQRADWNRTTSAVPLPRRQEGPRERSRGPCRHPGRAGCRSEWNSWDTKQEMDPDRSRLRHGISLLLRRGRFLLGRHRLSALWVCRPSTVPGMNGPPGDPRAGRDHTRRPRQVLRSRTGRRTPNNSKKRLMLIKTE